MPEILLIDSDLNFSKQLAEALRGRKFGVEIESHRMQALQLLRQRTPQWDLAILIGRNSPEREIVNLRELIEAAYQFSQSGIPSLLFVSMVRYQPHIRVRIERMGVRYVQL